MQTEPFSFGIHNCPAGIMFHHFHGGIHKKSQGSITQDNLDRIIRSLFNYDIISPQEWLDRCKKTEFIGNEICFTFDDNLKCQFDLAKEVLDSHNIKAFWFVYTSPFEGRLERLEIFRHFRHEHFDDIESFYAAFFRHFSATHPLLFKKFLVSNFKPDYYLKDYHYLTDCDKKFRFIRDEILTQEIYFELMEDLIKHKNLSLLGLSNNLWMTEEDLRNLTGDDHSIGLHTHTHPTKLSSLAPVAQKREFLTNKLKIEQITGVKPKAASFPNNSYSAETLRILKELDVETCFTATPKAINEKQNIFPRYNHITIHNFLEDSF